MTDETFHERWLKIKAEEKRDNRIGLLIVLGISAACFVLGLLMGGAR